MQQFELYEERTLTVKQIRDYMNRMAKKTNSESKLSVIAVMKYDLTWNVGLNDALSN